MRKTAVLLTSALVWRWQLPMVSAAPVDVTGTGGNRFEYAQNDRQRMGPDGQDGHRAVAEPEGGRQVKLGIELETAPNSFDDDDNPAGDFTGAHGAMSPICRRCGSRRPVRSGRTVPRSPRPSVTRPSTGTTGWVVSAPTGRWPWRASIWPSPTPTCSTPWRQRREPGGCPSRHRIEGVDWMRMVLYHGGADQRGPRCGHQHRRHRPGRYGGHGRGPSLRLQGERRRQPDGRRHADRRLPEDGGRLQPDVRSRNGAHIVPFHKDSSEDGFNVGIETVHQGFTVAAGLRSADGDGDFERGPDV